MSDVKITDLVSQEAIDKIRECNKEIWNLLDTYQETANKIAAGLKIEVKVIGDIDKLEKLLIEKTREATVTTDKLNEACERRKKVVSATTPVIARELMEQERVNKAQRETYDEYDKVNKLIEYFHDKYEDQVNSLIKLNNQLDANKKAQKENKKALEDAGISADEYNKRQAELIAQHRSLTQQKKNLTQIMTAEEKAAISTETGYKQMSQQLELLKMAYKDLSAEGRTSDFGKELEAAIQNLDMHLKETGADMGEFQRNVGNYAIAGRDGVVSTDSLREALNRQAITMQDVADQTKILEEAKRMLDTSDEHYAETLEAINDKIDENKARLSDVSDIMDKQASTVAEAEAQNKRLAEALKNVDLTSDDAQARISELNEKIDENNRIIEEGTQSKGSIKKDLKELVLEIANLSIEYQNLSEEEKASAEGQALHDHIQTLIERAGELKDAIADVNQAIGNAASDTRGLDQLCGGLQLAIDGFGLAEGAAHLLGITSEELTAIQTKLQAAIAASNAMQSIQNTLQSQSALMQGVNLVQLRLRTTAEKLHTAAQGKGLIATKALTVAQWLFNTAASANPIGLVVVAITACIGVVWGLVKAFKAFFGTNEEAIQQYEAQKRGLDELSESHNRYMATLKARGATETELLNQSLQNKEEEKKATDALFARAEKLYKKDKDEYKEALEAKKKADEEFEKNKEDSLNYLYRIIHQSEEEEKKQRLGTYEYKRQLIEAELKQQKALAATLLAQEKITRQIYENLVASLDKAAEFKIAAVDKEEKESLEKNSNSSKKRSGGNRVDEAKKQAEDLKKAVEAGEDALLKIIEDSLERQRAAEKLSYARQLKNLNEQLEKLKANEVSRRTSLYRQIEGLKAEHERKMNDIQFSQNERRNKAEADLIQSHLDIAKVGSEEERAWRYKMLDNQYQAELLNIVKNENEKTITIEEAEQMRTNLTLKYANLRDELEEEFAEKRIDAIEKEYAESQNLRDNAMMKELNDLKARYLEEVKAAKGNSEKMEEIERDFQRKSAEIEREYAEESARAAITLIEDCLKEENLSVEERERLERKLAKAKMELDTMVHDHAIETMKNETQKHQEEMEKRIKAISFWMQVAADAINGVNELASAIYDRKIQHIEEEEEANQEAAEKEEERISDLVSKKVITEEEGEARKRAAEAQTARKEEELARKKADLQYRQAVWDKANSIAQIGISTALALMRLWVQPAWPACLPLQAVVGTMSALQLATILATPIPKYRTGTDFHKGGPAIVGDGGRAEVISFRGLSWLTPDTPTLVEIPKGAAVIPSMEEYAARYFRETMPMAYPSMPDTPSMPVVVNDYSRLEAKMESFIQQTRRQTAFFQRHLREKRYSAFKDSIF